MSRVAGRCGREKRLEVRRNLQYFPGFVVWSVSTTGRPLFLLQLPLYVHHGDVMRVIGRGWMHAVRLSLRVLVGHAHQSWGTCIVVQRVLTHPRETLPEIQ